MSWTYKQHEIGDITQFPENTFGFVYMTTHKPSGKSYIGKKVLFHNQKKKLGKKELAALTGVVGRRPSYKLIVKESDWLKYYGSQSDIKQLLLEGKKDEFERTILKCVQTKKQLTYFEIKYQNYRINFNIVPKYYPSCRTFLNTLYNFNFICIFCGISKISYDFWMNDFFHSIN